MVLPSDCYSKTIAITAIIFLMIMFGLASYLNSFLKGKINKDLFTISQSLAFGNKPLMVSILTISFMFIIYLNYYRGHKYLLVRLFLLLLIYSLIITIIWVTTYYNIKDHYILATVIFSSSLLYVYLNSIVIYSGLKNKTKLNVFVLYLIPILMTLGFLGLIISNISPIRNEVVQLFPSFENYTLSIMGLSIFALGFI